MRVLTAPNRGRGGLMVITIVALVVGVGQSITSVPMLFATPTYYAQFKDAGGIHTGDKIQMAGVNVGRVRSLAIDGDHIVVGFSLAGKQIGKDSHASIRTDTILGRKNISIEPRGSDMLRPDGVLPVGQTSTPYQVYDAFFDVTKAGTGWDIDTVKRSLNVLSETIDQTSPHLSEALRGVKDFADTIGTRDDQITGLLANARKIATIFGDRSEQINKLLVNAQTLLGAVNARGQAITFLLERVDKLSTQVEGFINDNPNLHRALEQLRVVSDVLRERKSDLVSAVVKVNTFINGLGEGLASGPYFKAMLGNLLPYWVLQPWVDAAFKKRGIDPENFWRGAGLPAYRFPDPNGARFPNGAPPPAPPVLEGTPDHPGPAVPPGSPCSYTPPADGLPRPRTPLPCAGLDQSQGPFGPLSGPRPGLPDVLTSPPNLNGLPPTPGIPIAGRPGEPAPRVPGVPVPLPPNVPPGARTENVAPAGPVPPPSTFAPGLPPGPAAPPGPGPQVPPAGTPPLPGNPPYLAPGSQGRTE